MEKEVKLCVGRKIKNEMVKLFMGKWERRRRRRGKGTKEGEEKGGMRGSDELVWGWGLCKKKWHLNFLVEKKVNSILRIEVTFISPCSHTHPRIEIAFLSQKLAIRGVSIGHLGRAQATASPHHTFVQISKRSPFWVDAEGEQGIGSCSDLLVPLAWWLWSGYNLYSPMWWLWSYLGQIL